jgi:hypothetical protein
MIELRWYWKSSQSDRRTGYGSTRGRMTLAEIAEWCVAEGIDPTTISINGNVRTERDATGSELAERAEWRATREEHARDWEQATLRRLLAKYGTP